MVGSLILPAENLEEPKNPKSIKRLIKGGGWKMTVPLNTLLLTTDNTWSPRAPLIQDLR